MIPGADSRILDTLQAFGFEWDGEVSRQSTRLDHYRAALAALEERSLTFECSCSRTQLADETRYPGLCRAGPLKPDVPTATRLRVEPGAIDFTDRIQGRFRQDVALAVGDVALRRRDGLFAYVLAVVVDDAAQGVTQVVRGADLLDNTPRQILLQRLLHLPTPGYAHVPVLTEPDGRKLAKSARSVRADPGAAGPQLHRILQLLNLGPPPDLLGEPPGSLWHWAFAHWRLGAIPRRFSCPLEC